MMMRFSIKYADLGTNHIFAGTLTFNQHTPAIGMAQNCRKGNDYEI
jgi:hypothetical protein